MSGTSDGYIAAFRSVNLPDQPTNNSNPIPSVHLSSFRLRPDPIRGERVRTYFDILMLLDLNTVEDR
ncbi:hypothetical protein PENTCL1PPCAC_16675, partial [Pristionchus entomophagus]